MFAAELCFWDTHYGKIDRGGNFGVYLKGGERTVGQVAAGLSVRFIYIYDAKWISRGSLTSLVTPLG